MAYDEPKFVADLFRIGVDLHRRDEHDDASQVETAAIEVERLLAEVKRLRGEAEALVRAWPSSRVWPVGDRWGARNRWGGVRDGFVSHREAVMFSAGIGPAGKGGG